MKKTILFLLAATTLLAQSPSPSGAPVDFPLEWKPLEGWRTETIPFPLDFAPSLSYPGGVEELRFSPKFGQVDDPLYFTYAFVWVVPESEKIDLERMKGDLKAYFDGLMTAVAKDKKLELGAIDSLVTIEAVPDGMTDPMLAGLTFKGTVKTKDAFFSQKDVLLEYCVYRTRCEVSGKAVWYFEVSPQLTTDEMRILMAQVRAALGC